MPEFLIRVVDKGPNLDQSKRGDVIAAQPDGWAWSQEELTRDDWRIVSANVPQTLVDSLLSSDPPDSVTPIKRRRNWSVDFTQLPNQSLYTGARTQQIITVPPGQLISAAVKKP